jgi:hypothetical protein
MWGTWEEGEDGCGATCMCVWYKPLSLSHSSHPELTCAHAAFRSTHAWRRAAAAEISPGVET